MVEDKKVYDKGSKVLSAHFKKWKAKDKSQYLDHFSQRNWENLPEIEKKQHEKMNCKACSVHHYSFQSFKPTLKAIKKAATKIYEEINGPFKELFGMSFATAQTKTPELSLQDKKSKAELKKERREKLRIEKKQIEEQWSKRDCDTMLARRQIYQQRQEQRLALFFETPEEAENRAAKRKNLEDSRLCKRKRHSPKHEDLEFDRDGLLQEVNGMKDGDRVSISIKI